MTSPTLSEIIESSLLAERTADVSDQASRVEEEEAIHRRVAHDRKMRKEQDPDLPIFDPDKPLVVGPFLQLECEECGLEIGLDRIKVSLQNKHCVHCASLKEKRAQRR